MPIQQVIAHGWDRRKDSIGVVSQCLCRAGASTTWTAGLGSQGLLNERPTRLSSMERAVQTGWSPMMVLRRCCGAGRAAMAAESVRGRVRERGRAGGDG